MFGGNLLKQPMYKNINYRIPSELINSDIVMKDVFWIGVQPQLQKEQLDYVVNIIKNEIFQI